MRRLFAIYCVVAAIAGLVVLGAGLVVNVLAEESVERYFPDPGRLFPPPDLRPPDPRAPDWPPTDGRQRRIRAETVSANTLVARRVVLSGNDVTIDLRVDGDRPGITMTNRAGHAVQIYFASDGRAVVGVRQPGQQYFSAAMWANQDGGVLQMRDRNGTFVMEPSNIYQRRPTQVWR